MPRRIKRRKPKLLSLPKNRRGRGDTDLNDEQLLVRKEEAFRLRVDEGLDYRSIGERMGTNRSTAHKDVQTIAKMKYQGMIERDELVLLEHNATYDRILALWMPMLQPLLDEKIIVGETKTDRKGKEYDITMAGFESAKTATEVILKAMSQRERVNGYSGSGDSRKPSQEALEGAGLALFELMRQMNSRPIQATIIDSRPEIDNG